MILQSGSAPDVPFGAFKAQVTGFPGQPQVDVDAAVQQTAPAVATKPIPIREKADASILD